MRPTTKFFLVALVIVLLGALVVGALSLAGGATLSSALLSALLFGVFAPIPLIFIGMKMNQRRP